MTETATPKAKQKNIKPATTDKVRKSKTLSLDRLKEEINKLSPEGKVAILAYSNEVIAKERERLQQQLAVLEPGIV